MKEPPRDVRGGGQFLEEKRRDSLTGLGCPFYEKISVRQLFFAAQLSATRCNAVIALRRVGDETGTAVLDAVFGIGEAAAAVAAEGIEGAVTEQAVEPLRVGSGVAGKVFAFAVGEKTGAVIHVDLLVGYLWNSVKKWQTAAFYKEK